MYPDILGPQALRPIDEGGAGTTILHSEEERQRRRRKCRVQETAEEALDRMHTHFFRGENDSDQDTPTAPTTHRMRRKRVDKQLLLTGKQFPTIPDLQDLQGTWLDTQTTGGWPRPLWVEDHEVTRTRETYGTIQKIGRGARLTRTEANRWE